jgi:hypothetical protein
MRKAGVDRKPRQAYSSKQLEKLEDEFKVTTKCGENLSWILF